MALARLTGCSEKAFFANTPRPLRMGSRNIAAKCGCSSSCLGSGGCQPAFVGSLPTKMILRNVSASSLRSPESQPCNRRPNIIRRHVAGNMRFTDFRRDHKSNFATGKFLIVCDRVDDFVAIDLSGQLRRQLKILEQCNYIIPLRCGKPGAFHRNRAGRDHPDTDAIPVRNLKIASPLDPVPHSVTKIEERALPERLSIVR